MYNVKDLMNAVQVMWQGMLAIFIVMALIALIVYIFTKFSK
ncbi:MAG: sodium pump decarboxylase gamma subunit [Clostridia bacterium]|nr:sodium pump decarboxylase gamma subunit [Clostridia bacterium]